MAVPTGTKESNWRYVCTAYWDLLKGAFMEPDAENTSIQVGHTCVLESLFTALPSHLSGLGGGGASCPIEY